MIPVYKTYSAEKTNLDSINAHDFFVREILEQGVVHKVDPDNINRGVVLYDPDKWSELVEAVNASNDEFDEMEGDDEEESMTEGEAKYITDVTVIDPDSNLEVTLAVFKDQVSSGIFAIDASFLESDTLDERGAISSPFDENVILVLTGID